VIRPQQLADSVGRNRPASFQQQDREQAPFLESGCSQHPAVVGVDLDGSQDAEAHLAG
jgi:hypothetical protein